MLQNLRIENLAIIDRCEIEFESGFNVLTGETGAGKSVILGALQLLLGERSNAGDVRTGAPSAQVEARFALKAEGAAARWLAAQQLDSGEGEILLRREINDAGRSRCFINGRAVTLALLRELGERLIDLHGQHQHQSLLDVERQREALDQYGVDPARLAQYRGVFNSWRAAERRLRELQQNERELHRRKDALAFQVREIDQARLQPGEDEELQLARERLRNAEQLRLAAQNAWDLLDEGEAAGVSITGLLSRVEAELGMLARIDATCEPLLLRHNEISVLAQDLAAELRRYRDAIESDPQRLETVDNRLEELRRLKRKYGGSVEEIIQAREEFSRELSRLENRDERVEQLAGELKHYEALLRDLTLELSRLRGRAAEKFGRELIKLLAQLRMERTRFEVRIERRAAQTGENGLELNGECYAVSECGVDHVEYLISPNPGEDLRPLRRIASGGELSRIMLALKTLIAGREQVPVMVFDEIDVGISGRTAESVGAMMAALSANRQLLCITHLPQIASRAHAHFAVSKCVENDRTRVTCTKLKTAERKKELARLMAGAEITAAGLRHAGELLKKTR